MFVYAISMGEIIGWVQTVADTFGITSFIHVAFVFLVIFMVIGWFARRGD